MNAPSSLLVAVAVLVLIHLWRSFLDETDDVRLLLEGAFIPARWSVGAGHAVLDELLAAPGPTGEGDETGLREALARLVVADGLKPWTAWTYSLLHGSWAHLGLNALWLVTFGAAVVRRAGNARSLVLALAASAGGALAQWIADPLSLQPVIGASAIVSGFMAAAATFAFGRPVAPWMPRPGRWAFLRERGALVFLAVWLGANLLFGAVVPLGIADGPIAWQAHLGGLLAGLALFPFLDPGPPDRGMPPLGAA